MNNDPAPTFRTFDYTSKKAVKALLESEGLTLKKRFGQNFLLSKHGREKVFHALQLGKNERLWEIGPGIGSITAMCAGQAADLKVFEIDYGLIRLLETLFRDASDFTIIPGDFLDTGITLLESGECPDKIAGNLPYSSGSAMIYKIIETGILPKSAVFTLQKEVVRRICAAAGSKDYSLFTLVCAYAFDAENLGDIGAGAFFPAPEVVSTLVRLTPHNRFSETGSDRPLFFKTAKALFASRRKTIKNNLLSGPVSGYVTKENIPDICAAAGITPADRGENLEVEKVVALSRSIGEHAAKK